MIPCKKRTARCSGIPSGLKAELARILGRDRLKDRALDLEMYAFDSSPFSALPDLVAFPQNTGEVSRVLTAAAKYGVPVMPRGAGTCLSGGAVPVQGGISLSLTRMNQILDLDPFSATALVEPGVVNLDLQKALEPFGLMFPPDPASQRVATIGGNVAECAGGIQGARYGVTKNYVLGLELVLADGSIVTTGLLNPDETLGADFTGIFVGSEGVFAVITKILVSLRKKPQAFRTALAAFADLNQAALAVSGIIGRGIIPTALELMDQTMLRAVDDYARIGFPKDAEAVLLMEVDGFPQDLDRQLDIMVQICRDNGAQTVDKARTREEREALWKARRSGNGALGRIRPAYMVHDVTVPRNQVAPLLTRIREIGKTHDIIIAQMAHAGDGNAHPHLLYYPDEENIDQRLHQVTGEIFAAALELKGTISGEHGIGLEKMPFMTLQFSPKDLAFMEKIRACLDPARLLNPGKVLPRGEAAFAQIRPDTRAQNADGTKDRTDGPILEFIPDNLTLTVKGDAPLARVQEAAETIHAWLPLDTETHGRTPLSELVEAGAWGRTAMAFGALKEHLFGMTFTTRAKDRVCTGGHTAKNVAGFDFTRLLWQSRGTLGKIETLTLKLSPLPETRALAVRRFDDLRAVLALSRQILAADISLVTLMADRGPQEQGWTLMAGLAGSQDLVRAHLKMLEGMMSAFGCPGRAWAPEILVREEEQEFWQKRAADTAVFPALLARGMGTRRALFDLLAGEGLYLDQIRGIRLEMDLGYPALRLWGPQDNSLAELFPGPDLARMTQALSKAGFYTAASDVFPASDLYARLRPRLVQGGFVHDAQ